MRRPSQRKSKYSPSYWAELVDPRHLSPGWARWTMGLIAVLAMLSMPLILLIIVFGVLRFIWITIAMFF